MMEQLIYSAPIAGVLALAFAFYKASWVKAQDAGDATMKDIAEQIQTGAMAFLKAEYRVLAIFVVVVAGLLALANMGEGRSPIIAVSFVVGALASAAAGWFGMKVATDANVRTTAAAREGLAPALNVAFNGGAVMGMTVVGLAIIGLGGLYILYTTSGMFEGNLALAINVLTGFSMGASSIALFARVGGGIYTKAADVGADLVGKVEAGLPEDDPRNPAVIADNVGDNVGDVAGMGADLFESFVGAIIGAMVLGLGFDVVNPSAANHSLSPVTMPLIIAAAGIVCSILGTFVVKTKEGGNPQHALDAGAFGSAIAMAIATFAIANQMWPEAGVYVAGSTDPVTWMEVGGATVIGLVTGIAIGLITSYYCSMDKGPVDSIANQSKTGTATNIIAGLGVGMQSTAIPILCIAAGVVAASSVAGLYGVAIAALGMLSTTGIQLAVDAYGPIADNAGGIAEMSEQDPKVRERTDKLDAVGNTTAAIGKGFAIGSAAMTALALFAAFAQTAGISGIDISKPVVMAGLFIGGMLPFLFSSMAMKAVGEAAMEMIEEVRRQFREIDGLLEGKAKPDTAKCVEISTNASIKRMMMPGALAIVTPVVIGFGGNLFGEGMGAEMLGGLLAGVTVSGVTMAIFMSNAGGAWDNAKKSFEGGGFKMDDGTVHEKGSEAHKAAVVGDTVGDPFKDTAGPSLNILVKLMSVVALVMAPLLASGTSIADVGAGMAGAAGAAAAGAAGAVGDAAGDLAEGAGDLAEGAAEGAANLAEGAAEGATNLAEGAVEGAGDLVDQAGAMLRGYDLRLRSTKSDGGETMFMAYGAVPDQATKDKIAELAGGAFDRVNMDNLEISDALEFPADLDTCLEKGIDAMSKLSSARIDFDDDKIDFTGEGSQQQLADARSLTSDFPASFSLAPLHFLDTAEGEACDAALAHILETHIQFDTGSDHIDEASNDLLDQIKSAIEECPEGVTLDIDGHTDSQGDDAANMRLSQERANAVKAALVERGIAEGRLLARAFGETLPIGDNATEEGREENRRIEIHLDHP